ncbi:MULTISPECIES: peptidylprolyl isomerase [Limnobacter]|uniref:peptidylprolyl isomerase n=2 Tax=Limnobacter TaxID=131079 RepID=A0ABQ5YQ53_9BURK|nr:MULTISPECIES: peptidylprolyl isomerase [Limnobacter]GLR25915.1 peptidylprolyl isomerase [Limnobacter litoralis]HEX5484782.1 peptidylprolyl isomerase [Limnobacter sp.]
MLKSTLKLSTALMALLLSATAFAQNAALVNGQPLSSDLVDFIVKEQAKRGQAPSDEVRAQIRQELINQEVLKQEAIKKGLANDKDVKLQTQMMNQAILANALHENFMKTTKLSDAEVQSTYDKIAKMMGGEEYRASHILVQSEKEAKDIIAQLDKGANFADLAKKNSKDPGSAKNGGDLDWANANSFVPEFSKAMVALKKGEYTKEPVKSQFGYHVIMLTDVRKATPPALADIRPQLEQKMLNDKWNQYQQDLLTKAKIK